MGRGKRAEANVEIIAKEGEELQPIEILQDAIIKIAASFQELKHSRIKDETIIALIHDKTNLAKYQIKEVFDCLTNLEDIFLKPK